MLVRFGKDYMGIKKGEIRDITELAYNQLADSVQKIDTENSKGLKRPDKDKMIRAGKTHQK